MKKIFYTLLSCFLGIAAHAQVSTPGTGVHWNFDSLANHFPTTVVRMGVDSFHITNVVNIQPTDTLFEANAAEVYLDSAATFNFKKCGVELLSVTFYAMDTGKKFLRVRLDSVLGGRFAFFEMRYGKGMSLINSRVVFENSRFFRNKTATPDPSGAVSFLGSYAEFSNTVFTENSRSALNVAANGNSGMKVIQSNFIRNNTENGNYPQINIGSVNDSGIVIRNCNIRGRYPRGGGIGFLNLIPSRYKIDIQGNTIYGNRYGIAVTGRNVYGIIADNTIDSNCIENNPMLGGSGLNFQGDSSLHIIVARNIIRQNLWGVTMQITNDTTRAPQVSFGRIAPLVPGDTGRNVFSNNGNNGMIYAIYNNTHDTVWAQNNTWDDTSMAGIEQTVFHHVDSAALGWVIFSPRYVAPVPPSQGVITVPGSGEVKLWPNPVRNGEMILVNSKLDIQSYAMYNVNGQRVASGNAAGNQLPIRTGQFSAGIYYLALSGKDWKKIIPVVVQ